MLGRFNGRDCKGIPRLNRQLIQLLGSHLTLSRQRGCDVKVDRSKIRSQKQAAPRTSTLPTVCVSGSLFCSILQRPLSKSATNGYTKHAGPTVRWSCRGSNGVAAMSAGGNRPDRQYARWRPGSVFRELPWEAVYHRLPAVGARVPAAGRGTPAVSPPASVGQRPRSSSSQDQRTPRRPAPEITARTVRGVNARHAIQAARGG